MLGIGFQEGENLFYEGHIGYGRPVTPSPILSCATFLTNADDTGGIPETNNLVTQFVFREDAFDPVTRIRRGRIYKWPEGQAQPHNWKVYPHPAHGIREAAKAANRRLKEA